MKVETTNLTVRKTIVDRIKAISARLAPPPSTAYIAQNILEEALAYIESNEEILPPLNFLKDLRARLGKVSGHEFAQEIAATTNTLERRLQSIERALKLRPELYALADEETPKAAEHPKKKH